MKERIRVENLIHTYMPGGPFEKTSVNGITMSVYDGEFLGIVGHTGSGKSTLIQHFNGILKPSSGRVLVDGEDISKANIRDIRFKVGMVFQYAEYQLFEETVFLDMAFGPKNQGLSEDEVKSRVMMAAEAMELDEKLLKKSPFELSGGQKRRAAIGGVIAMQPEVLVLDEPTAGLDPKARDRVLSLLKELNKSHGLTVVIVSHSMEDIAKYADRMIVLSKGKLALSGVPKELFQRSGDIERLGLAIPSAASVVQRLCNMGHSVDKTACTPLSAAETIAEMLNKISERKV